jgi:hypothetical protein
MFAFDPALAPIVILLVTQGIKSVFGSISGYGSMIVAAGVASLLLFGEAAIGGLGPQAAEVVTSVVQLLLVIAGGFGLKDTLTSFSRRRV